MTEILIASCLGIATITCMIMIASEVAVMIVAKKKAKATLKAEAEEPSEEEKLAEAVKTIRIYCENQTEEGHCKFNLNETNAVCECRLLKNIPEDWADDNKE